MNRYPHRWASRLLILPLALLTVACQAEPSNLERRVISTHGYGEVKATPDQAVINFTARATSRTGKDAKQGVDDQVNALLQSMQQLEVSKEDIVASQLRIQPRYEYRSNAGRFFAGYEATRTVRVTLKSLDKLTQVMDAGLGAGIDTIDSVNYESSKDEQYRREAHQQAIADSKAKAGALAKAYGAELGPIVRIDYHNDIVLYGNVQSDSRVETAALRSSKAGVYLPDKITFTDRIQVVFDLIVNE